MNEITKNEAAVLVNELLAQAAKAPAPTAEELDRREAEREARTKKLIEESRRADAKLRFEKSCPNDFLTSDWDFPAIRPFRAQIDRILNYKLGPKGLMASGPTGRRKTGAMWALMRRLTHEEGRDVRFYTAIDFFGELQQQVKYGTDDARGWIETVARRPIVFIDDYGQHAVLQSKQDWALGWFLRFLDIRSSEHLPLFVTTNMTAKDVIGAGDLRSEPLLRRIIAVADPVPFETDAERHTRQRSR